MDELNHTGYAQVMEECIVTNSQVVTLVAYAYGLDLISQTFPPNSPLSAQPATFYYGYDGHGSVRYLMDDQGGTTDTYDYDAFGVPVQVTGTTPNCYFYAGEQLDHDLGMYFLRARYLNHEKGRFWTMDVYEGDGQEPLSLHKYLYCHVDPVNGLDPTGTMLLETLFSFTGRSGLVAYHTVRVANVANKLTLILFESVSGGAVVMGAGTAVGTMAAFSKIGVPSWTKAATNLRGIRIGTYEYLAKILARLGRQAHHLNQTKAYTRMKRNEAACVDLAGNAFVNPAAQQLIIEGTKRSSSQP